jgi:hypothetical protein
VIGEIAIVAVAGHLLGDWFLQNSYMAAHKESSWLTAFSHATVVSLTMLTALTWTTEWSDRYVVLVLVNLVTHAVIDRRTAVRWWMKNVQGWDPAPFWGVLALDQALHFAVIALTVGALW